jgi:hypothetical protein
MSDKPMSNIPGRITASAEMLEAAVADLLRLIPETWQAYRPDDLSETKAQALFMLTAAGRVERRDRLRLRMLNHPLAAEATITVTGEYGAVEALESLIASLWQDWQSAYIKWRHSEMGDAEFCHSERREPSEWRLTDQGVIARKNLDAGKKEQCVVFDFVLKRGFFRNRDPVRGVGSLVKIDKVKADSAAPGAVNIANWHEGGDALVQALGPLITKGFEAMQAHAFALTSSANANKTATRRGRKKLSPKESQLRQEILGRWERAGQARVTREQFCKDEEITSRELQIFQDWARQRENRSQ